MYRSRTIPGRGKRQKLIPSCRRALFHSGGPSRSVAAFASASGHILTKRLAFTLVQGLAAGVVFVVVVAASFSKIVAWQRVHPGTGAVAIRCADNSVCSADGLVGDCCPTSAGVKLGCCSADGNVASRHETAPGACDDNSACAALGLAGDCCSEIQTLSCCGAKDNKVEALFEHLCSVTACMLSMSRCHPRSPLHSASGVSSASNISLVQCQSRLPLGGIVGQLLPR